MGRVGLGGGGGGGGGYDGLFKYIRRNRRDRQTVRKQDR